MNTGLPDISDRSRFYIEHRESIEQWHRLRREAVRECCDLLDTSQPAVEDQAAAKNWLVHDLTIRRWRMLAASPPGTPVMDDGAPLVLVGVEWDANDVVFDDPAAAPYVGIRCSLDGPVGKPLRDAVEQATREVRKGRGAQASQYWPLFERVVATDRWWDDPQTYLDALVARFVEHLELFGETVVDLLDKHT